MEGAEYFDDESEEIAEGFTDCFRDCNKSHDQYIPIDEVDLSSLPEGIRHESVLEYILLRSKLVVLVSVQYTSMARPDDDTFAKNRGKKVTISATGYAWTYCEHQSAVKCPNESCVLGKQREHDVYRGILITTNRHVIFNDEEATNTEITFFYDNKKSTTVKGIGYALREDLQKKDYVSLKIYYHDASLFNMINKLNESIVETWDQIPSEFKLELAKHAIVISHPHGNYKRVSFGTLLGKEVLDQEKDRKETSYTSLTCKGSSGAPVITGLYWTNPFVHSSARKKKKSSKNFIGLSFTY